MHRSARYNMKHQARKPNPIRAPSSLNDAPAKPGKIAAYDVGCVHFHDGGQLSPCYGETSNLPTPVKSQDRWRVGRCGLAAIRAVAVRWTRATATRLGGKPAIWGSATPLVKCRPCLSILVRATEGPARAALPRILRGRVKSLRRWRLIPARSSVERTAKKGAGVVVLGNRSAGAAHRGRDRLVIRDTPGGPIVASGHSLPLGRGR